MVFSEEDKALIKNLYLIKGYRPQELMNEFPGKNWKRRGLDELLKKLRKTGTTERRKGSDRPRSARTEANVSAVQELALSQEDQPQTHRSVRQISRETGIPRSSVSRIIHDDLASSVLKTTRARADRGEPGCSIATRQKASGYVPERQELTRKTR